MPPILTYEGSDGVFLLGLEASDDWLRFWFVEIQFSFLLTYVIRPFEFDL